METFWMLAIFLSVVVAGISILLTIINKNEKARRNWIKTVKPGDMCNISSPEYKLETAKIVDISDENIVTIEIKVTKRWLYPPKKSKS